MKANCDHLMEADIPFWFIDTEPIRWYPEGDVGKSWIELTNIFYPKLKIKHIGLQFRDHIEIVTPDYAPGYFFIRSAGCWHVVGGMPTEHYYNVGWIEDGKIRCGKWKMPEIELIGFHERSIEESSQSILYNG